MMTHTLIPAALPSVTSVSSQGSGDSSSVTGSPQSPSVENYPDSSPDPPVSLQAKQGQAAQYRLSKFNQQVNSIAKSLRLGDQALAKLDSLLEKAKRPLIKIVKSFPPFPVGSEERVKLLKSYNAFSKMIDKLTVPPVESDPLQGQTGQSDSNEIVQPIFSGDEKLPDDFPQLLKELDIPGLVNDVDNEKIEIVIKKINDTQVDVDKARTKLFDKAAEIRKHLRQGHPFGDSISQKDPTGSTPDESKMDAIGLSHDIKQGLLSIPAGNMHVERSVLIDLL